MDTVRDLVLQVPGDRRCVDFCFGPRKEIVGDRIGDVGAHGVVDHNGKCQFFAQLGLEAA